PGKSPAATICPTGDRPRPSGRTVGAALALVAHAATPATTTATTHTPTRIAGTLRDGAGHGVTRLIPTAAALKSAHRLGRGARWSHWRQSGPASSSTSRTRSQASG